MGRSAFRVQLQELGHDNYESYLRSAHWRRLRLEVLEAQHGTCFACRATDRLHVHHKTYVRLGAEQPADLVLLCDRCHEKAHKLVRGGVCKLADAHEFVVRHLAGQPLPTPKKKRAKKAKKRKLAAQPQAPRKAKKAKAPPRIERERTEAESRRAAQRRKLEEKYARRRAERRAAREAAT